MRHQCPACGKPHTLGRGALCADCQDSADRVNSALDWGCLLYLLLLGLALWCSVNE